MKDKDINRRITQLEEYLRRNSHEFEKGAIPDHSFYSYRHSNRLFSLRTGESIKSFANKIRLQNAAEYLIYSSRTVFDIAMEVGYESSASFSKAFKKAYALSPTAYRAKCKETDQSKIPKTSNRPYSIERLDLSSIQCKKMHFDINISDEDFYELVKNNAILSASQQEEFMLFWDEDPYTVQSNHSRCFIAVASPNPGQLTDQPPIIEGKYAIFDTSDFSKADYESWHKLAFLILELDKVEMRESTYVEFYPTDVLNEVDLFLPSRIALAVE